MFHTEYVTTTRSTFRVVAGDRDVPGIIKSIVPAGQWRMVDMLDMETLSAIYRLQQSMDVGTRIKGMAVKHAG